MIRISIEVEAAGVIVGLREARDFARRVGAHQVDVRVLVPQNMALSRRSYRVHSHRIAANMSLATLRATVARDLEAMKHA